MPRRKSPVTAAVRALRSAGVEYTEHLYDYDRFPGAMGAAEVIGVDPAITAKTIVLATSTSEGLIVLMNGDREISTKRLARHIGVKETRTATQREATAWSGYQFGGTSPLGLRTSLPVYAQKEIAALPIVYVNAGKRGFVIGVGSAALLSLCDAQLVDVAV